MVLYRPHMGRKDTQNDGLIDVCVCKLAIVAMASNDYSCKAYTETYNEVHIASMYWSLKSEKTKAFNNWNANPGA